LAIGEKRGILSPHVIDPEPNYLLDVEDPLVKKSPPLTIEENLTSR
jgi:hypothetical protein